jgi:hypothetical protein
MTFLMPRRVSSLRPARPARLVASLVSVLALGAAVSPPAVRAEQKSLLDVDWNDPDLKKQMEERAATRALGAQEESALEKLKIPVFDFEAPPAAVTRSLGAGPQEAEERTESYDVDNPVWYEIVKKYGDVTVSVEADRRVQQHFGPDYDVLDTAETRGIGAAAEPDVSVLDDTVEEGMEGSMAEYTIYKAGVPYTVTIECRETAKEQCKDGEQIAKDAALLKYIGGKP